MGALAQARLVDPIALVITPDLTVFAGGGGDIVEAISNAMLGVVAGLYYQTSATGNLARFRDESFGSVDGVAYDAAAGLIYLTETSANRVQVVTITDPTNRDSWTIAPLANTAGTAGFQDGAVATAQFRGPTGLYLDAAAHVLYVADTGNHVIRAIDVAGGMVSTVAGTPATRGFFGDGGPATAAELFAPQAITACGDGDLFVADTGNNRIRRVAAGTGMMSTVLGVGVAASSGEGIPATTFAVDAPLGLACDGYGNVLATSSATVRLLAADHDGVVDGTGAVATIYGRQPRTTFPASVTHCLTGIAIVDAKTVEVTDACIGLLIQLQRSGP
jgi:sugar lactone lactonase YvrE